MSWDEFFPERFRRRRPFPFFDERHFQDIDRLMEELLREISQSAPKELVRERRLPSGETVREMGPFIYGYSMTVGPDGKPVIRQFGNVKPSVKPSPLGVPRPSLEVREEREPLIDIFPTDDKIKVVAELPGVEKPDINLHATENTLTISVDTEMKKFYKELELPARVEPKSAVAAYHNGVLEVTLDRAEKTSPRGERIQVR